MRKEGEGYEAMPIYEERDVQMMLQCALIAGDDQLKTYHVAQSSMIAGWPVGGRSVGSPFNIFKLPATHGLIFGISRAYIQPMSECRSKHLDSPALCHFISIK